MTAVRTRRAAVAGLFYPERPEELTRVVDGFLRVGALLPSRGTAPSEPPVAVVVPHAGYVYSGRVAGAVYARLAPFGDRIGQVVVIGPAHRARVEGIATVSVDALATPLGPVAVADDLRRLVLAHAGVHVDDRAHADEHCLEVQLPFLQRVLGEVQVLPLVVGSATPAMVADVLGDVWGRPGVLVVISTDLSHYHDAATAAELDARTAAAVLAGDTSAISWEDACGATPLRAALIVAGRRHEHAELVDICTSADTAGTRDRVVGYGGFEIR